MAIEVKIPPMGESITSGILASWRVKDGDAVKRNQPLFELETDKITSEGVADADGIIRLAVEEGAEVEIGQVVATIETGSAGAPPVKATAEPSREKAGSPSAAATEPANRKSSIEDRASGSVSPAVRRIATESGIDPATVAGSGKGGRVTKGDMLQAVEAAQTPAPVATPPAILAPPASAAAVVAQPPPLPATPPPLPSPIPPAPVNRRKMTPLRAKIAQRLVQAKNQTAMLTTFNEVDMSAVRDLRARYQEDFTKKHGVKLGFMSLFVKAAVHGLNEVPAIKAQIDGDFLVEPDSFDIGVAVSTDRGLMVPVVRDCAVKSVARLELDIADYAKRAREGKITLEDLAGGVFTITNGGIFGSLLSTPILNPPQSAILGMHAIQDRPIAVSGQVVIRPMMYLALSYDHRVVDGREAVTFLVKVKQAIEDPARLWLEV